MHLIVPFLVSLRRAVCDIRVTYTHTRGSPCDQPEGHMLAMKEVTGYNSSSLFFIDYRYRLWAAPNYMAEQSFCRLCSLPHPHPPLRSAFIRCSDVFFSQGDDSHWGLAAGRYMSLFISQHPRLAALNRR